MNDSIFQILRMNLHSSPESELCAPPVRPSPQKDYHNAPLGQGRRSARDAPLGQPIAVEQVEEKFEKYFGYLARCEAKFCTTTLKNRNLNSKLDQNTETDAAKIWNFDFWKIVFRENEKSGHQN